MAISSAEKIRAIGETRVGGRTLADVLVRDGVSYLAFLQTHLAFRIARTGHEAGTQVRTRARFARVFLVLATVWGFVRLFFSRPRIIFYGTDMMTARLPYDPRMAGVYRWLDDSHISYGNLIHATSDPQVIRRWYRRSSPLMYYEGLESLASVLMFLRVLPRTFHFPLVQDEMAVWCIQRANNAAAVISLLTWMVRRIKPEQIWSIDDSRYWLPITVAAHRAGLPIVLFQHGRFTRDLAYLGYPGILPDLIPIPDSYIVWNEFWKEQLTAISPVFTQHPDAVSIGGHPGSPPSLGAVRSGGTTVVFLHEPHSLREDVHAMLTALTASGHFRVMYKIRQDRSPEDQLAMFGLEPLVAAGKITVSDKMPEQVGLVVGFASTLLFEVIQMGVPVAVCRMRSLYAEDLILAGLAAVLDLSAGDFDSQIISAMTVDATELDRRAQRLHVSADIRQTCEHLIRQHHVRN
jgi:hypothetical protein